MKSFTAWSRNFSFPRSITIFFELTHYKRFLADFVTQLAQQEVCPPHLTPLSIPKILYFRHKEFLICWQKG